MECIILYQDKVVKYFCPEKSKFGTVHNLRRVALILYRDKVQTGCRNSPLPAQLDNPFRQKDKLLFTQQMNNEY